MGEVIVCILIADFITGCIHWIEDCFGLPTWPLIGRAVIEPNILHHKEPNHFTMSSILYRNYQVLLMGAAGYGALWLAGLGDWRVALVIGLASIGNETHAWAHKRPKNTLIRLLQDMKLLISPEQHARHHKPPYTKCYCTLTNWVNPVLDALQFWQWCEWALALVGIEPKRMSAERGGV